MKQLEEVPVSQHRGRESALTLTEYTFVKDGHHVWLPHKDKRSAASQQSKRIQISHLEGDITVWLKVPDELTKEYGLCQSAKLTLKVVSPMDEILQKALCLTTSTNFQVV
ncbi:hypothetical protein PR048_027227 [Dryococelus australis]|uniref:Uncharacterized protein n=1 Tax=Dryococelus australis TaxID=614101 RepID=A0ABQ9GEU5_9NEOP|nr:hypothetical protein PR048_027227 [Dryococelus australis]